MKSIIAIIFANLLTAFSAQAYFTDSAPVLLADGSQRDIADIGLGETLFGGGTVTMSARKKIDTDTLYSFNQSAFFFDAGQVFKTVAGYKAIDPNKAAEKYSDLGTIGALVVGDQLVAPNNTVITVTSLERHPVAAGTKVYHLRSSSPNEFFVGTALAAGYRR